MPTSRLHPRARRTLARGAVSLLLATLTLAGFAGRAAADDAAAWELFPAVGENGSTRDDFHYSVAAGEQLSDAFTVVNTSGAVVDLDLYAGDAFTTDDGELDLRTADIQPVDVAAWLRLAADHVTLEPGEQADIPFSIAVPSDAAPGDHLGGIVASRIEQSGGNEVERRLALRVQLRVGTDVTPRLAVEDVAVGFDGGPFGSGDAKVGYTVRNTGDVILGGEQHVTVSGPFGWGRVDAEPVADLPQLLPGESFRVSATAHGVARTGVLDARVQVSALLSDAAGSTGPLPEADTSGSGTGWAAPWIAVIGLVAVVALVLLFARRGGGSPSAPASPGDGEVADAVTAGEASEHATVARRQQSPRAGRAARLVTAAALLCGAAGMLSAPAAQAHGFSSVAYADVTSAGAGVVRATLDLEYDLLVVSAADLQHAPELFELGTSLFQTGDEARALNTYPQPVLAYVTERFAVTAGDAPCTASRTGKFTTHIREGVPYATVTLDYQCPPTAAHEVSSSLFGDSEGYVTSTKTIVTYALDDLEGSAALDAQHPSFSIEQTWQQRFAEFFLLGAEHLLTGIDHILFLLALIVGSRRLRDIVLAATTFTVAHSVTFLLAATGVVHPPAWFVEPTIAFSIAVVAIWHLVQQWRRSHDAVTLPRGRLGLDRADWLRLGIVFAFGLVHGLGFAGALGIDEPWSWTLLWSLLVFNVGIEVVQLSIILVAFPLLALLRKYTSEVGRWTGALVAAGVAVMGMIWFVERVSGVS